MLAIPIVCAGASSDVARIVTEAVAQCLAETGNGTPPETTFAALLSRYDDMVITMLRREPTAGTCGRKTHRRSHRPIRRTPVVSAGHREGQNRDARARASRHE